MKNHIKAKYAADGAKLNLIKYMSQFNKTEDMYYDIVCSIKNYCEDCLEACDEYVSTIREREKKTNCRYDVSPYKSWDKEYQSEKFKLSKSNQDVKPVGKTDNLTVLLNYIKKVTNHAVSSPNINTFTLTAQMLRVIFPNANLSFVGCVKSVLDLPLEANEFDIYVLDHSNDSYVYIGGIWWLFITLEIN